MQAQGKPEFRVVVVGGDEFDTGMADELTRALMIFSELRTGARRPWFELRAETTPDGIQVSTTTKTRCERKYVRPPTVRGI